MLAGTVDSTALLVAALGAALLAPAGVAKLQDPARLVDALGLRRHRWAPAAARVLGVAEIALAAAVLVLGGRTAVAVLAAVYAGFTVVAFRQQRRGADCGCFGDAPTPTTWGHVLLDLVVAAAAVVVLVGAGPSRPVELFAGIGVGAGVALLLGAAVAVATAHVVLTGLPELRAATRRIVLLAPSTPRAAGTASGGPS